MAAIFEIGGHIEMIWTPKWYLHHQLTFYILTHITHRFKSFFDPSAAILSKMILHDSRRRPSWKLAAILKWSKLLNRSYNINCTFYMIKTQNLLSKLSFLPSVAILWRKIGFQDSPWRWSWKIAAILKFCMARVIFLQGNPCSVHMCTKSVACIIIWKILLRYAIICCTVNAVLHSTIDMLSLKRLGFNSLRITCSFSCQE